MVGVGRFLLALPHPTGARAPYNPLPHSLCIPRTESRWGGPSARMFLVLDTGHGGDSDSAGREILLPRILTATQLLRECCTPFDTCWKGLNCQLSRKK